jgi:hypothetical protein
MKTNTFEDKPSNGKIVQWIGWGISLIAFIYTIMGYIDITSDASTRSFAPLILVEGAFFVGIGLVVVWVGHKRRVKAEKKESETQN